MPLRPVLSIVLLCIAGPVAADCRCVCVGGKVEAICDLDSFDIEAWCPPRECRQGDLDRLRESPDGRGCDWEYVPDAETGELQLVEQCDTETDPAAPEPAEVR